MIFFFVFLLVGNFLEHMDAVMVVTKQLEWTSVQEPLWWAYFKTVSSKWSEQGQALSLEAAWNLLQKKKCSPEIQKNRERQDIYHILINVLKRVGQFFLIQNKFALL